MKLSASMEKALNEQYVKELYSAYLYLSMSKDMKRDSPVMHPGSRFSMMKNWNTHLRFLTISKTEKGLLNSALSTL